MDDTEVKAEFDLMQKPHRLLLLCAPRICGHRKMVHNGVRLQAAGM